MKKVTDKNINNDASIKVKDAKKYLSFLNKTKGLVGFSGWKIVLIDKYSNLGDELAEVEVDIFEQFVKIKLSEEFLKMDDATICNVLFHELVHGRVLVFNKKAENLVAQEEEFMVNDLVRGYESFGKFTLTAPTDKRNKKVKKKPSKKIRGVLTLK